MSEVAHSVGGEPVPLVDPFGRVVRDLRVSVTDRCNLRCRYCMPEDGLPALPRAELLTFDEIERVTRVCVERFGVGSVRITGGEPTLRAGLPDLVRRLATLGVEVSMTTNGARLAHLAPSLAAAGLSRVNVSCDSLRRDRFLSITRRDALDRVMEGIAAAVAAGLQPVKVNCVLVRGRNDDEIGDFARFGRERHVTVRFIEFMPLDADEAWSRRDVVPGDEVVATIGALFPLVPVGDHRGSAPARRYRYLDGRGEIGVISSVTDSFCTTCDRVRLTTDGKFRSCLFAHSETDLRTLLRAGSSDDDLAAAIEAEVGTKWAGHSVGQVSFLRPSRSMSQIGG